MKQLKDRYDINNIQDNDIDGYGIKKPKELDYSKIDDVEIEGIDPRDAPDFCDAFISSASYDGRDMTEEELEELNQDTSFVYEAVLDWLY